jgi:hypothetical protein
LNITTKTEIQVSVSSRKTANGNNVTIFIIEPAHHMESEKKKMERKITGSTFHDKEREKLP